MPRTLLKRLAPESVSTLLVIYAGGTLGMLRSKQGYVVGPGFLYASLRSESRFHDPSGDSLMSHAHSLAQFEEWTASRPTTPTAGDTDRPAPPSQSAGASSSSTRTLPVDTGTERQHLPCLITPKDHLGRRIRCALSRRPCELTRVDSILEYDPLIDSSDVDGQNDWLRMASTIERNYARFDGFVILHGTDTMAYTASALSFLLENLGKPVVITGAQIPLSELRNDAIENVLGAITVAGLHLVPEVSLLFAGKLFRGNRSTKSSAVDLDAFTSPNLPALADIGINVAVRWDTVLRPTALKSFRVHHALDPNVAHLSLYPTITGATVRAMLAAPIRGVVMSTYGAGNAPQRPGLIAALREACQRGVVIVNVTQCARGSVVDLYASGRQLADIGIVNGRDMTVECALAKLSYLLGHQLDVATIRELMGQPLRGELTPPTPPIPTGDGSHERILSMLDSLLLRNEPFPPMPLRNLPASLPKPPIADVDALTAERALYPVLISAAAARSDETLGNLLNILTEGSTPLLPLLNTATPVCQPPLHVAAATGLTANVVRLLKLGASVHLRDVHDRSALFHAARGGHLATVEVLREVGAHLADAERRAAEDACDTSPASLPAWTAAGLVGPPQSRAAL